MRASFRTFVVILILVVLLLLTTISIYGLRSYQNNLPEVSDCKQYSSYTATTVDKNNSDAVEWVWMKLGLSTAISDSSLNGLWDNYKNKSLYRYFVNVLVGCVVGVINYLIKVLFYKLSSFERYKSITREESSLMRKQFYSMFINIGILILFINANFQGSSFFKSIAEGLPGGTEYFFNGRYSDLDRSWYSKVGLAIIVMIVTSLITNVISWIIFELIYLLKRKWFAKKQILQIDMNTWMDGSYFNLSYKYALTMSIFAWCIMYWGPIPILIPVCALYFIWEYWIDKIFFLRLNKIPAYYSQSIHNAMLKNSSSLCNYTLNILNVGLWLSWNVARRFQNRWKR